MRTIATAARIARNQYGRVSWEQLVAAGVGRHAIQSWIERGLLHPEHHGVYAFGHRAPSLLGDLKAAELASGPAAAISHASAAHVGGMTAARPAQIEVTVPTVAGRSRPGVVVHRVRALPSSDVFVHRGIRMTTAPRVLLDLAPRWSEHELTRAGHEAWVHHGTTLAHVEACIARNPRKPGAQKLRRALGADVTLSALEDGFLELLARHGLPLPRTNIAVAGDKVDCHWPEHGLTIELLSYRFHASRRAFEADVARRRRSSHIAYTWGDVFERGSATAAEVSRALDGSRPNLGGSRDGRR